MNTSTNGTESSKPNETTYRLMGYFVQPKSQGGDRTVFDVDIVTSAAGTVFRIMRIDEPGEFTGAFTEVKEAGTMLETLRAIAQASKDLHY